MSTTTTSLTSFADELHLEQCHAYVIHHLQSRQKAGDHRYQTHHGPAITITYQLGAGAREVSQRLTALMRAGEPIGAAPWTIFDREVVEAVLEEHHLPPSLAPRLSEDYRPYMQEVLEEALDLRTPSWVMTPKIEAMVRRLADAGNVILMGHCAGIIARDMPGVFHARVVAPLELRVARIQQSEGLSREKAADVVRSDDRRRGLYARRNYNRRPDDESLYHMILNTERMSFDDAAEAIASAARRCLGIGHVRH